MTIAPDPDLLHNPASPALIPHARVVRASELAVGLCLFLDREVGKSPLFYQQRIARDVKNAKLIGCSMMTVQAQSLREKWFMLKTQ